MTDTRLDLFKVKRKRQAAQGDSKSEKDERNFLLAMREGLLIQLGAVEDLLELPRTRIPKRKR